MRPIGWLLVVISAGWLFLTAANRGPIFRAIVVKHHEGVPKQETFSEDEVHRYIYEVVGSPDVQFLDSHA